MEAATALADSVQEYGGILGAAVSCRSAQRSLCSFAAWVWHPTLTPLPGTFRPALLSAQRSDKGGLPTDDITTCGADMPMLLDRMFELAKSRNLDLDFHVDENQNPESKGLRYISEARGSEGGRGGARACAPLTGAHGSIREAAPS